MRSSEWWPGIWQMEQWSPMPECVICLLTCVVALRALNILCAAQNKCASWRSAHSPQTSHTIRPTKVPILPAFPIAALLLVKTSRKNTTRHVHWNATRVTKASRCCTVRLATTKPWFQAVQNTRIRLVPVRVIGCYSHMRTNASIK